MPDPADAPGSLSPGDGQGVPVPERGAWLRRGISRNGGPLVEDREVVWLQAGPYFADSRGFAGVTSFDGSRIHFHHLEGEPGEDTGTFRWQGANLVERGTNTDGSTFLEIWTPLPAGDGDTGSWAGAGYHVVRVGRHLVHVDSRAGTYWRT
ncbi:hypothetical protein K7B10_03030 [Streptomyces flavotricini]|uniref:Uncharacterized protein n=1 Tax=Streptomyces flavotricini TaxID=66888 RepID=A0ABS8DYJ8_9ACTN|nr:hypothetical protein [Streptomyces flavotricini]MCC0093778.1 hypothetical protein [Streptomyces flavotricini]